MSLQKAGHMGLRESRIGLSDISIEKRIEKIAILRKKRERRKKNETSPRGGENRALPSQVTQKGKKEGAQRKAYKRGSGS